MTDYKGSVQVHSDEEHGPKPWGWKFMDSDGEITAHSKTGWEDEDAAIADAQKRYPDAVLVVSGPQAITPEEEPEPIPAP